MKLYGTPPTRAPPASPMATASSSTTTAAIGPARVTLANAGVATKEIVTEKARKVKVTRAYLEKYAGVKKFRWGETESTDLVGVTNGLACNLTEGIERRRGEANAIGGGLLGEDLQDDLFDLGGRCADRLQDGEGHERLRRALQGVLRRRLHAAPGERRPGRARARRAG